jgi:hypothetical protein
MKAYDTGFVCLCGKYEGDDEEDCSYGGDDSSCNLVTAYNATRWVLLNGQDYL